jgi:NADH dehydrogenase (ubiquinone) 1 beta subcomplex subunit 9
VCGGFTTNRANGRDRTRMDASFERLTVRDSRARFAASPRSTLRTVLSWCVDRNIFYEERDRIRRSFEANAGLKDLGEIEKAVSDGEKTLESYAHPDPYTIPTMYGGSKYARNPETPAGAGMVFDFGREPHTVPK